MSLVTVAAKAEDNKVSMYCHLDACYQFVPVAVETCGTFGPQAGEFFRELWWRVRRATLEPNAYQSVPCAENFSSYAMR